MDVVSSVTIASVLILDNADKGISVNRQKSAPDRGMNHELHILGNDIEKNKKGIKLQWTDRASIGFNCFVQNTKKDIDLSENETPENINNINSQTYSNSFGSLVACD